MTPYDLKQEIARAQMAMKDDTRQAQNVIFGLLVTLLRHEADKEADKNLERRIK